MKCQKRVAQKLPGWIAERLQRVDFAQALKALADFFAQADKAKQLKSP